MAKGNKTAHTDEPQVFSLADHLARPVTGNTPDPLFLLDENTPIEHTTDVEFDEVPGDPEPQPATPEPENTDTGFMHPRDLAETIVNLLDGLQSSALPYLIEKKIFTEAEREILQTLDTTGATLYQDSSKEAKLYKKWLYYQKKVSKVPFSPGESKRLINATERYAKTVNLQLTPLQGLLAAYSEVIVNRGKMFFID